MHRRNFLTLLGAGALAGCTDVLDKPYVEKRYFVIEAARPSPLPAPAQGPILGTRKFRVSPGYEQRGLITRGDALSAKSDFYNEFFVAPGSMIEEQTTRWLAGSGLFQTVVPASSQLDPAFILEGALVSLYGDYGAQQSAVLELQLMVLDVRQSKDTVLVKEDYRITRPLADRRPETLVQGWNQDLAEALRRFEQAVRTRLPAA